MKLYYENHLNERFDLNQSVFRLLDIDDLFSCECEVNTYNGLVSSLASKYKAIEIEFDVLSKQGISWKKTYTKLCEIIEKDIVKRTWGKLYFNDYYLDCFIDSHSLKNVNLTNFYATGTLHIISNFNWKQKHLSKYFKTSSNFKTKTYPHGYPYQYQIGSSNSQLANVSYRDSHFVITIYGPCLNPTIAIEDNTYTVNTKVEENEILIIDYSSESVRKIEKIDVGGAYSINCFNARDKSGNFFKKIKSGINLVTWDGSFAFDVLLFEERSQPKWI